MKEIGYIRINGIYKKLRLAETENLPLYVHAPVGYGKTAAVMNFYRKNDALYLSGDSGSIKDRPDISAIRQRTVIVDDVSWIEDSKSIDYIKQLLGSGKHIVLIGRSVMPNWLSPYYVSGKLLTADETTMTFDDKQIMKLAEQMDIYLGSEEQTAKRCREIYEANHGYPVYVIFLFSMLRDGEKWDSALTAKVSEACFRFYDTETINRWDDRLVNFLLSLADFESFDKELATVVALEPRIEPIIEYALSVGDFLRQISDSRYEIRPSVCRYLMWKRKLVWSVEKERAMRIRAYNYYRIKDNLIEALRFAYLAGDKELIKETLITNAERNPSTAHFYETRWYYENLPEEDIESSPTLMSGVSMLNSLLLKPQKSEEWYRRIQNYLQKNDLTDKEYKQVRSCLAYLDVGLPHRNIEDLTAIIKKNAALVTEQGYKLREFSVTSNLPSLINSGRDLVKWCHSGDYLKKDVQAAFYTVIGAYGAGFMDILRAEMSFECQSEENYNIISLLQSGIADAENNGMPETCFAGTAVLIRLHLSMGKTGLALRLLDDFEGQMKRSGIKRFDANIRAMRAWLALIFDDLPEAERWLAEAPNENLGFDILARYRYMVKMRLYIALGRYEEAWGLSVRLDKYFDSYGRTYQIIENRLLQSIISYRLGRRGWKTSLNEAVDMAKQYGLIFIIAKKGAAIVPLLKAAKTSKSGKFYLTVLEKACEIEQIYPSYLARDDKPAEALTKRELAVLKMHCDGMSTAEIMQKEGITESTLKFHNKNIYRKLGVKNKKEAVEAALRMKLE